MRRGIIRTKKPTPAGFFELGDIEPAGKAYNQCLNSVDQTIVNRLKGNTNKKGVKP